MDSKLEQWADNITDLLPNFVLAIIVFSIFLLVGRFARRAIHKVGNKMSSNKAASNILGLIANIVILLVGLAFSLEIMNLSAAATSILAGAGIAGIALGFALQDIAANFISGILLALQRPFKIGDLVLTQETFGTVRLINLRSTEIETLEGQYVHIPNKDILLNPLVDYSHIGSRRIDLTVGVAFSTDLDKAEEVALQAISKLDGLDRSRPIDMYYNEFGHSSIKFTIRYWIPFSKQPEFLTMQSMGIKAIKKAFDEAGIAIPFPMRTLEISSHQEEMFRPKKKGLLG